MLNEKEFFDAMKEELSCLGPCNCSLFRMFFE